MKYLFLFFLLIGCSSYKMYNYHKIDSFKQETKDITPLYLDKDCKEENIINNVINEWNIVFNKQKIIKLEENFDKTDEMNLIIISKKIMLTSQGIMVFCATSDHEMVEDVPKDILAFVNDIGDNGHALIILTDRIGNRNLHKIILHEFGHLFGAQHVNAISLMYPHYGDKQTNCVDKITMLQVANYNKLDPKLMNYCSIPMLE